MRDESSNGSENSARTGDDRKKEGRNLKSQLDMCREYALSRGYCIVAELAEDDRGVSGADFDLPKLREALELAWEGAFEVFVTRELDRFARDLAKQLHMEREFKRAGVAAEYVLAEYEDSPEGGLTKNVRAIIAEYERLKTVERMDRGRRNKVRSGSVCVQGRPPFGYDVVKEDGKYQLRINESEAQVVRMVYSWYTEGDGRSGPVGTSKIAHKLTDMGILTFADRRPGQGVTKQRARSVWPRSSVIRMLKNETYAGVWHFGKDDNGRDPIPVEVPPIVSSEVWKAAQAKRVSNTTNAKRNRKNNYLVGRRVICGRCGYKMYGNTPSLPKEPRYSYYCCPAHHKKRDYEFPCDMPSFRAGDVDAAIWDWVKGWIFDPEELVSGLEACKAKQEEEFAPLRERVTTIENMIADNRLQLERILDLYVLGEFPKEMLTQRKVKIERTIATLESERGDLIDRMESEALSREQIQDLQDFVAKVARGWETAEDTFEARRKIIELIDLWVTLDVEDGQKTVHARCRLGSGSFHVVTKSTRAPGRQSSRRGRDINKTTLLLGFEVTSDLQGDHAWRVTAL